MRRFRGIAALVLVVALVAALGACKKVDAVATVNGTAITRVEFDRVYKQVADQMGGKIDDATALEYKKQLLEMMIESELITQDAKKLGADLSDDAVNKRISELMGGETDQAKIEQQATAAGITMEDLRDSVKDEIAREFVTKKASEETSVTAMPETYSLLSHILVDDEARAKALYDEIKAGGDFAALASANSTDTASAVDGGSLGWAPTSAYVPDFRAAADALKVGEVSEPVKSDFGWHIIKKVDEYAKGEPIKDAPAELRATLESSSSELVLQQYVKKLRDAAKIVYVDETLKPSK